LEEKAYAYEVAGTYYDKWANIKTLQPGKNALGYKQETEYGRAEWASDDATEFPIVNKDGKAYIDYAINAVAAYISNFFEMETAQMLGLNLDEEGMTMGKRRIYEQLCEGAHKGGIAPNGLKIKGVQNFLNGGSVANSSIPKVTNVEGASGYTWADKTGNEIIADLRRGFRLIAKLSKGKNRCTHVLHGLDSGDQVAEKTAIEEQTGFTRPVIDIIQKQYSNVSFVEIPYFDGVGGDDNPVAAGATPNETWTSTTGDNVVVFLDNEQSTHQVGEYHFKVLRPYETKALATKTNMIARSTGLQIIKLYTWAYLKGV
jgi:hypothetical protein